MLFSSQIHRAKASVAALIFRSNGRPVHQFSFIFFPLVQPFPYPEEQKALALFLRRILSIRDIFHASLCRIHLEHIFPHISRPIAQSTGRQNGIFRKYLRQMAIEQITFKKNFTLFYIDV